VNENLFVIGFLNCFRLRASVPLHLRILEKAIKIPMYVVNEVAVNAREGRRGA
jgi:hypothetical protein